MDGYGIVGIQRHNNSMTDPSAFLLHRYGTIFLKVLMQAAKNKRLRTKNSGKSALYSGWMAMLFVSTCFETKLFLLEILFFYFIKILFLLK